MFSENALTHLDSAQFRKALTRAGYSHAAYEQLGLEAHPDPYSRAAVVTRLFDPDSPFALACRLFDAGEAVSGKLMLPLFGQNIEDLVRLGLIEPLGSDLIRSAARLEAHENGWFAYDHPSGLLAEKPDHTMGCGKSTLLLSSLAPTLPNATALDLCTGAGWVAIQLAKAGCKVTATDLNTRALGFARFNARLADSPDVELLAGDMFAPVEGRRFDVITANPPFVISPESTFTYRDSGCRGDSFCEDLARRIPDFLNPGGIGIFLLNWYDDGNDESLARPHQWVRDSGCGSWLFRGLTQNPADYAQRWLRDTGRGRSPDAARFDRWISYFHEIGAQRIHFGFLAIHRGNGSPWTRTDIRDIGSVKTSAGAELRRVVQGEDWLACKQPTDEDLLNRHFKVTPGIHVGTDMLLEQGWKARTIRLMSPAELSYDGQIDEFLLRLLELSAANHPPSTMVAELQSDPRIQDPSQLAPQIAGLTRELIRHGMLIPK